MNYFTNDGTHILKSVGVSPSTLSDSSSCILIVRFERSSTTVSMACFIINSLCKIPHKQIYAMNNYKPKGVSGLLRVDSEKLFEDIKTTSTIHVPMSNFKPPILNNLHSVDPVDFTKLALKTSYQKNAFPHKFFCHLLFQDVDSQVKE